MLKDIFKGINIGLGFILVIGLLFGIVYAVGFHTADEILGGNFSGNYLFTGDVNFTGSVAGVSSGSSIPVGSTMAFFTSDCPSGWLNTNGSTISRTTYSDLFSELGEMYGSGDGSTTFNLPDTRGYFLRSWADGSSMDPDSASRTDRGDGTIGDSVGTIQEDATAVNGLTASFYSNVNQQYGPYDTYLGGNLDILTTTFLTLTGDSETRPRNINVLYCIKY